jgi:hypothetical protein
MKISRRKKEERRAFYTPPAKACRNCGRYGVHNLLECMSGPEEKDTRGRVSLPGREQEQEQE